MVFGILFSIVAGGEGKDGAGDAAARLSAKF